LNDRASQAANKDSFHLQLKAGGACRKESSFVATLVADDETVLKLE
jgi:hypothetical protein